MGIGLVGCNLELESSPEGLPDFGGQTIADHREVVVFVSQTISDCQNVSPCGLRN